MTASPPRRVRWVRALLLGLSIGLGSGALQAHRPTESTAEFRWEHGRLEARLTFPLEMAAALLENPEVTALSVENFAENRPRLIERAGDALVVEIEGQRVIPVQITAGLSREGEAECVFIFSPHPLATLSVRAPFLEKIPPDGFCLLRVWDGADRLMARRLLVRSSPRTTVLPSDQIPNASALPLPAESHRPSPPKRAPKA